MKKTKILQVGGGVGASSGHNFGQHRDSALCFFLKMGEQLALPLSVDVVCYLITGVCQRSAHDCTCKEVQARGGFREGPSMIKLVNRQQEEESRVQWKEKVLQVPQKLPRSPLLQACEQGIFEVSKVLVRLLRIDKMSNPIRRSDRKSFHLFGMFAFLLMETLSHPCCQPLSLMVIGIIAQNGSCSS